MILYHFNRMSCYNPLPTRLTGQSLTKIDTSYQILYGLYMCTTHLFKEKTGPQQAQTDWGGKLFKWTFFKHIKWTFLAVELLPFDDQSKKFGLFLSCTCLFNITYLFTLQPYIGVWLAGGSGGIYCEYTVRAPQKTFYCTQ